MLSVYEQAVAYHQRGWKVIPIKFREKRITILGWQEMDMTLEEIAKEFNRGPSNIGVIWGKRSGWVIDIDLDCDAAVEVAPHILPPTMSYGRETRRRSHLLYICPGMKAVCYVLPHDEARDDDKVKKPGKTLCEIRSTGQQSVAPPSFHKDTGEAILWEEGPSEPLVIEPEDLMEKMNRLAVLSAWRHKGISLADIVDMDIKDFSASADVFTEFQTKEIMSWAGIKKDKKKKEKELSPEQKEALDERDRYNLAHTPKEGWGSPGRGTCPVCGDETCFGEMPDDTTKWYCFSTDHLSVVVNKKTIGTKGNRGYWGDALDIDAFKAGKVPREHLILAGGSEKKGLIEIRVSDRVQNIEKTERLLGETKQVFHRRQKLVEVFQEQFGPMIGDVTPSRLEMLMGKYIEWQRWDAKQNDLTLCDPPQKWARMIHEAKRWPKVPFIKGISSLPIFREDGSVCDNPGYDEESQLMYIPSGERLVLKEDPTWQDANEAIQTFMDLVEDFPFAREEHFSVWLSTVLSRIGWNAFDGGAPLTVIDATVRGAGKSMLANVSAMISLGRYASTSVYTDKGWDDDEMRKKITTWIDSGEEIVLLDNLKEGTEVGWPSLNAMLTAKIWQDRKLGTNDQIMSYINMITIITGNRLVISSDIQRRTLQVLLESEHEKPETRTDIKYPDDALFEVIKEIRPKLLQAGYSILRAYIHAGKPKVEAPTFQGFGGWSKLIRSSLIWAGAVDPVKALMNKEEDNGDMKMEATKTLLRQWSVLKPTASGNPGVTLSEALAQIIQGGIEVTPIQETIKMLCPTRDKEMPEVRYFGKVINTLHNSVKEIDGKKKRLTKKRLCNATYWQVETLPDET